MFAEHLLAGRSDAMIGPYHGDAHALERRTVDRASLLRAWRFRLSNPRRSRRFTKRLMEKRETLERTESTSEVESATPVKPPRMILLIRHGQTTYNVEGRLPGQLEGVALTDEGRRQAQRAAVALSGLAALSRRRQPAGACTRNRRDPGPRLGAAGEARSALEGHRHRSLGRTTDRDLNKSEPKWKAFVEKPSEPPDRRRGIRQRAAARRRRHPDVLGNDVARRLRRGGCSRRRREADPRALTPRRRWMWRGLRRSPTRRSAPCSLATSPSPRFSPSTGSHSPVGSRHSRGRLPHEQTPGGATEPESTPAQTQREGQLTDPTRGKPACVRLTYTSVDQFATRTLPRPSTRASNNNVRSAHPISSPHVALRVAESAVGRRNLSHSAASTPAPRRCSGCWSTTTSR